MPGRSCRCSPLGGGSGRAGVLAPRRAPPRPAQPSPAQSAGAGGSGPGGAAFRTCSLRCSSWRRPQRPSAPPGAGGWLRGRYRARREPGVGKVGAAGEQLGGRGCRACRALRSGLRGAGVGERRLFRAAGLSAVPAVSGRLGARRGSARCPSSSRPCAATGQRGGLGFRRLGCSYPTFSY